MPRITADNIAEHVAQQEALVFDTAMRLFLERGYHEVSLGDIAHEVGLARNSLYRYFPDKAHILIRWFRSELALQSSRSREILEAKGSPRHRIDRWVTDQLAYAQRPEHTLIAAATELIPTLDEDTRAELADSHRTLFEPLDATLAEAGIRNAATRRTVADLIHGLVLAAATHESQTGPDRTLRPQLDRAIHSLLP